MGRTIQTRVIQQDERSAAELETDAKIRIQSKGTCKRRRKKISGQRPIKESDTREEGNAISEQEKQRANKSGEGREEANKEK